MLCGFFVCQSLPRPSRPFTLASTTRASRTLDQCKRKRRNPRTSRRIESRVPTPCAVHWTRSTFSTFDIAVSAPSLQSNGSSLHRQGVWRRDNRTCIQRAWRRSTEGRACRPKYPSCLLRNALTSRHQRRVLEGRRLLHTGSSGAGSAQSATPSHPCIRSMVCWQHRR